jgi:hypothetical protein
MATINPGDGAAQMQAAEVRRSLQNSAQVMSSLSRRSAFIGELPSYDLTSFNTDLDPPICSLSVE